jgi:hypothetical protein
VISAGVIEVLHEGVRPREEQGFLTRVAPPHEEGFAVVGPPRFEDFADAIGFTDAVALNDDASPTLACVAYLWSLE